MFANFDFDVIRRSLGYLFFDGMTFTLTLTGLAALGGLIFGTLIALMRLSGFKLLGRIAGLYVDLMRSLPLVLVIFWFYFLVPYIGQWLTGSSRPVHVGAFTSSLVTFIMFEAAYFSEIMRAGIQSISKGQPAAAQALGLTYSQTMRYVVLPQAFRNMLPVLLTQTIVLFQDTSLVYVLSIPDFLGAASKVALRDLAGGAEEIRDRQHIDQRGVLEQHDGLRQQHRQHVAERLRQHDVAHGLAVGQAERLGGGRLALGDRLDAGAHDFGEIRRLEHDEGDERGRERTDVNRPRRAGQPLPDIGHQEIEPEDHQHQRQRPHQVDIKPGDAPEQLESRQPHQRDQRAEDQAAERRQARQRQRERHAVEKQIPERAADDVEIEIGEHRRCSLPGNVARDRQPAFEEAHRGDDDDIDQQIQHGRRSERLEHLKREFLHRPRFAG